MSAWTNGPSLRREVRHAHTFPLIDAALVGPFLADRLRRTSIT